MKKETIEMRVHHLEMLGHYIRSRRDAGAIKDNLILAIYDRDVTEEELDSFALNIHDFYEKVLSGKYDIKLTSKPDSICEGGCTLRKTGGCNMEDVREMDIYKSGIENYNINMERTYSLEEIMQIIEDYLDLNW